MLRITSAIAFALTFSAVFPGDSQGQTIFQGDPASNLNVILNATGANGDRTPIISGTVGAIQITPSDFAINTTAGGIASADNINTLAGTPLLATDTVIMTFDFQEVPGDIGFNGIEFGLSSNGTTFRPADNLLFRIDDNGTVSGLSGGNAVGAGQTDAGFGIDEDSIVDGFSATLTADASGWSFDFVDIVTSANSVMPGQTTASFSGSLTGTQFLDIFSTGHIYVTLQGEGGPGSLNGGVPALLNEFSIVINEPSTGLVGDFDGDGDVDCEDTNAYSGNLGAAATGELAELDLDGDTMVTLADGTAHVQQLVVTSNGVTGTFLGDVNCDGEVNVLGDAFTLVGSLGTSGRVYSEGDLNFDGSVDVLGDAFTLVGNLGSSNAE